MHISDSFLGTSTRSSAAARRSTGGLTLRTERAGGLAVVTVAGTLDVSAAFELDAALRALLDTRPGALVVDLGGAGPLRPEVIDVFVRAHFAAAEIEARVAFVVTGPDAGPWRSLGLADVLTVAGTREDAYRVLARQRAAEPSLSA